MSRNLLDSHCFQRRVTVVDKLFLWFIRLKRADLEGDSDIVTVYLLCLEYRIEGTRIKGEVYQT